MCTDAFTRSSYSDVLIRRLCIDETGASHVRGRYAGLAPLLARQGNRETLLRARLQPVTGDVSTSLRLRSRRRASDAPPP